MNRILFICALALCLVAVANAASLEGVWENEDRYGRQIYMCEVGGEIWGTYGWIGTLGPADSGEDEVQGVWVNIGPEIAEGRFNFTVDSHNRLLQGDYGFGLEDEEDEDDRTPWNAQRRGGASPDPTVNCLVPDLSESPDTDRIIGAWTGGFLAGNMYMCTRDIGEDEDEITQVFGSSDAGHYYIGYTPDDGLTFYGEVYTAEGRGDAILRGIGVDHLSGWSTPGSSLDTHEYVWHDFWRIGQYDGEQNERLCEKNINLFLEYDSSASGLVVPVMSLLFAVLAVLFF